MRGEVWGLRFRSGRKQGESAGEKVKCQLRRKDHRGWSRAKIVKEKRVIITTERGKKKRNKRKRRTKVRN